MDPIQSGSNPINNPRLDLLHNTGSNQQLQGAAGSYGPDATALHQQGVSPAPPAGPARAAASYIAAAQSKRPATPVPLPPPPPVPRPAPAPKTSPPVTSGSNGRRTGLIVVIILILLAVAAAGGWWWWTHRAKPAPAPASVAVTPVTPSNLTQVDSSNTSLDQGATTQGAKVTFKFNVQTSANSGSLTPEVELEPVGTAFTGQPTITGQGVAATSNMQFSVTSNTLTSGAYHWQARVSTGNQHSSWVVFGGDATATAFTVNLAPPAAPTVSSVGGASVANPTVVTSNRPAIVGKSDPNATITATVSPDSQKFTTTADSSGTWTMTPNVDIPNSQHQISITATNAAGVVGAAAQIAISVNPATAADTAPSPAASTPAATTPPATSTQALSKNLAATGDNTTATSVVSLAVMIMAAAGIAWMRRRYDPA